MTSYLSRNSASGQHPSDRSRRLANAADAPLLASIPSIDELGHPVLAINTSGVLRYANERASEVLGWDSVAVVGESVLPLVHPEVSIWSLHRWKL